ncbi:Zn-dependent amino- or carboxypeptidase, M28 family [Geodermatophilus pulveris]|uniref:Zn-dependent amino- or carboxypeptidase, M28 family n=1 Tax=Geodermatophilus pulveris TaxID=1564159 RepID=A0A239CR60_9ACTN|nr:M28 family peptidase [Geodermatophilus pulveris]SNS22746.1 Zn-dependent amino- or carboxypeptidase, M28 family [Geodermatophilus pulveris]
MSRRQTTSRVIALGGSGLLLALALPVTAAGAAPGRGCDERTNNTYAKLLDCVTPDGVMEHQRAFQAIADASTDPVYPDSRAAGTQGYAASVDHVSGLLEEAGYDVTTAPVEFRFDFPAVLDRTGTSPATYESSVFTNSGAGDVTGTVVPIDLALEPPRASTSGCEASDFAGAALGGSSDIALVQRGTCTFAVKVQNAVAAGAEAVVVLNSGTEASTEGLVVGTLDPYVASVPVVGASFADGRALAAEGSTARVAVQEPETRTDVSVVAELAGEDTSNVVMAGAHLDSVPAGPGINDNGSGSSALLETALMMANSKPQNTIRFGWWGAEELGLLGSAAYVESLPQAERDRIALYMNYDMVASPNHVQMVYDSDQSTWPAPVPIPAGSTAIEDVYESYYTAVGVPYDDAEYSGRSDYEAFIEAGIPSGGLFTGAEVVKTEEQAAIWGGVAGESFDPCYHLACDTIDNLAEDALDVNSDLIAFAMLTFASSTEPVNGVPGREVPGRPFELPAPAGPEGTFEVPPGGGGLEHDHEHAHDTVA